MFKFSLGENVYIVFEREDYDPNSKEECSSCYGSGKQYSNDEDNEGQ
jgi:hypothetical protein